MLDKWFCRYAMNSTHYTLFHFAFIKLKASDTMTTGKQTHELIAVARKGPLEGLNAPAFELSKIQK